MKRLIIRATNTVAEVGAIYALTLTAGAAGFALFEQKPFADALWWAAVTATSTGYGDLFPVTTGGRIIGALLMHVSILVILPLIIGHVIGTLIENQDRFTDAEQRRIIMILAELRAAARKPWALTDGDAFMALDSLGLAQVEDHRDAMLFHDQASARAFLSANDLNADVWLAVQVQP